MNDYYTTDLERGLEIIWLAFMGLLLWPLLVPAWVIGRIARRWMP